MNKTTLQLKQTLSDFGIELEIISVIKGPRVWKFNCRVSDNKQLKMVSELHRELQLVLMSDSVSIEIPDLAKNNFSIWVAVRDDQTFIDWKSDVSGESFEVSIGQDVGREEYFIDFSKENSLLVVGATGSGKSLILESIINSLMLKNNSDQLKFVFVDTKRVVLTHYGSLPHALLPVEMDPNKAVYRLHWVREEIKRRKDVLKKVNVECVEQYRDQSDNTEYGQLPQIVVIIEDFSDLIITEPSIEQDILEIIKEGALTGVSILISTSRPSLDVCTPAICSAVSNRLIGMTASKTDSITVIGREGAEKLLGAGDVLILSQNTKRLTRVQGYYLSEDRIKSNLSLIASQDTQQPYLVEKSWWDRNFSLWYYTPLILLFLIPFIIFQYDTDSKNIDDFDLGIDLEVNGSLPDSTGPTSNNPPAIKSDTGNKYESRSGNSAPYHYNYDVSGYGDSGYVYGNVDVQDKYGDGYIYNEAGEEIWVQVEWIDYGVLEAYDKNDNFYELEVD